jgi:hypothetical protein
MAIDYKSLFEQAMQLNSEMEWELEQSELLREQMAQKLENLMNNQEGDGEFELPMTWGVDRNGEIVNLLTQ